MRIARLTILLMFAMLGTSVYAETINCTPVTSLPAVISTQGIFCLTGNLATNITSGNAIEITANNVTLDLNGWKLGGQAAGTGTNAVGIFSNAVNVEIRNGIIRGFYRGIALTGRGGSVHGISSDQNTHIGIDVRGQGSLVYGNTVVDTGGSTYTSDENSIGIYVDGSESNVHNNDISGLTATGTGNELGILIQSNGNYASVSNNKVTDGARPSGGGASYGIRVFTALSAAVLTNNVANFNYGIAFNNGATGAYARNTVLTADTAYQGGSAGTGNFP
jgi:hypothetical protein